MPFCVCWAQNRSKDFYALKPNRYLIFEKKSVILNLVPYLGVAQLVARYLGVVEAVGSSPVTQTIGNRLF